MINFRNLFLLYFSTLTLVFAADASFSKLDMSRFNLWEVYEVITDRAQELVGGLSNMDILKNQKTNFLLDASALNIWLDDYKLQSITLSPEQIVSKDDLLHQIRIVETFIANYREHNNFIEPDIFYQSLGGTIIHKKKFQLYWSLTRFRAKKLLCCFLPNLFAEPDSSITVKMYFALEKESSD